MRDIDTNVLAIATAFIFVISAAFIAYSIGYDQGRNDGFKAGWREAMKAKEVEREQVD